MTLLPISPVVRRLAAALVALAGLVAFAGLAFPAAAASLDPTGTWLIADGRARIRIEKCGPRDKDICGYVVWLKTPLTDDGKPRVDFKNPDPKKHGRPTLGHQMIMGMKPNEEGQYEGKVYNSEEGKFFDVTISLADPNELSIRGCMLAVLCGSQSWTRVTDVLPGQLTGPTNGLNGPHADPEWTPKTKPGAVAPTQ